MICDLSFECPQGGFEAQDNSGAPAGYHRNMRAGGSVWVGKVWAVLPPRRTFALAMMSWLPIIAMASLLLGSPVSAGEPVQRLWPVGEAPRSPSFEAFRGRLRAIVARHDADALLNVVSEQVRISFGPYNGKAAFVRRWRPRDAQGPLWPELAGILAQGGAFAASGKPHLFCAPYVYASWPASVDAFTHLAVTDWNVLARATPGVDAAVVAVLDYAIVGGGPAASGTAVGPQGIRWSRILLPDRTAYVRTRYVRSPIGYRACFREEDGGWSMAVLVAGD